MPTTRRSFKVAAPGSSIHPIGEHCEMPKPRELVATLLGVRVARALYGSWRRLSTKERELLGPLADDVRERALDLRGATDPESAGRELQRANEKLADAMVESAEANPDVSEAEVVRLRDDLTRELERLVKADISASRGPAGRTPSGDASPVPRR